MNPSLSSLVPSITKHSEPIGFPVGTWGRTLLFAGSLCLLGGFCVAYGLQPDPRGYGTHQRLGFPPCSFRALFGIPCPSCGMTTSFANLVRGRFSAAAKANVAAIALAGVCAVAVPWSWLSVYYGRLCFVRRPGFMAAAVLGMICALSFVEWTVRILSS